eukprot:scaffold338277_cov22-Prasinocladus_malaysianus.AAC.1
MQCHGLVSRGVSQSASLSDRKTLIHRFTQLIGQPPSQSFSQSVIETVGWSVSQSIRRQELIVMAQT